MNINVIQKLPTTDVRAFCAGCGERKKGTKAEALVPFGVTSGIRTHDIQNHNLTL
jgi:hypothetical protein